MAEAVVVVIVIVAAIFVVLVVEIFVFVVDWLRAVANENKTKTESGEENELLDLKLGLDLFESWIWNELACCIRFNLACFANCCCCCYRCLLSG